MSEAAVTPVKGKRGRKPGSKNKKPKKESGGRNKQQKDPNRPKRCLSAYTIYVTDNRARLKQEHPDLSFGDLSRELARQWKELDPTEKAQYEAKASKDKERYASEMEAYKQKKAEESEEEESDEEQPKPKKRGPKRGSKRAKVDSSEE
ncbi:Non-histone chromosomal protein 6 [Balamuthia mandrillaris]